MTAMNTLATIALLFALAVTTLFGAGYAVARFIPPLRIAIRILGYLFLTLLIPFVFFIAYELSFYPPFTRSPQIFGQGESIHGKFMVVGSCEGFPDWQISLLWKPPGKPWAEYYLDCDGDYWTDFEMIDRECKELLDCRRAARSSTFSRRKIAAAIRVEDDMDDGLLQHNFVKCQLRAKKRPDLQAGNNVVYVCKRNIFSRLASMNGDATHFGLQVKWDGVDAGDFRAASGDALDFGNQAAAYQRLEGIGIDVDEETKNSEETGSGQEKHVLPPAADELSGKRGH